MERPELIKKLADETGKTERYIRYILEGEKRPSPELAERLEELTQVNRLAWLYPDQYRNELVKAG